MSRFGFGFVLVAVVSFGGITPSPAQSLESQEYHFSRAEDAWEPLPAYLLPRVQYDGDFVRFLTLQEYYFNNADYVWEPLPAPPQPSPKLADGKKAPQKGQGAEMVSAKSLRKITVSSRSTHIVHEASALAAAQSSTSKGGVPGPLLQGLSDVLHDLAKAFDRSPLVTVFHADAAVHKLDRETKVADR